MSFVVANYRAHFMHKLATHSSPHLPLDLDRLRVSVFKNKLQACAAPAVQMQRGYSVSSVVANYRAHFMHQVATHSSPL